MPSTASVSPVREILEGRLSKLLPDLESQLETHVGEVRERARSQLADQLNQAARRIHQASSAAEIGATLVEAAALFSTGAALFRIGSCVLHGERIRGAPEQCTASFPDLTIPLDRAPALAEAVRSRDPVTAIATPGEISAELANLLAENKMGQAPSSAPNFPDRIFLYPVAGGGRVPAVLCAWGAVEGAAVELLAQIAAAAWGSLPASAELVRLPEAVPARTPGPAQASAWDALSPEEQQAHLRAQRSARVEVAEIRLFAGEGVESGRARRDLYGALGPRIDAARDSFHKKFFATTPTMVDYLHLEILKILAHDDPDLLGKDYPGPLA